MARWPNVALFKSRGAKKSHQKNLEEMAKNMRLQFFHFLAHLQQKVGDPCILRIVAHQRKSGTNIEPLICNAQCIFYEVINL